MKCPNCQAENLEEYSLCKSCGQPLHEQPVCYNCRHVNFFNRKFCDKCGEPLIELPSQWPQTSVSG